MHDYGGDKKARRKNFAIKQRLKFKDWEKCLQNNKIKLISQQRFKREAQDVFTEKINKIALNFNDHISLKPFNKVKSHAYGTSVGKVCNRIATNH